MSLPSGGCAGADGDGLGDAGLVVGGFVVFGGFVGFGGFEVCGGRVLVGGVECGGRVAVAVVGPVVGVPDGDVVGLGSGLASAVGPGFVAASASMAPHITATTMVAATSDR